MPSCSGTKDRLEDLLGLSVPALSHTALCCHIMMSPVAPQRGGGGITERKTRKTAQTLSQTENSNIQLKHVEPNAGTSAKSLNSQDYRCCHQKLKQTKEWKD